MLPISASTFNRTRHDFTQRSIGTRTRRGTLKRQARYFWYSLFSAPPMRALERFLSQSADERRSHYKAHDSPRHADNFGPLKVLLCDKNPF